LFPNPCAATPIITLVADISTPIPGGSGTFSGFANAPSQDGTTLAFVGFGSANFTGVYTASGGTLHKVPDSNTPVPDGPGTFSDFSSAGGYPSVQGNNVAFYAFGGQVRGMAGNGVYLNTNGTLTKVADQNTAIPNGTGLFLNFSQASLDQGTVAFSGHGNGQQGIYAASGGSLRRLVDLNTPISGGSGTFGNLVLPELRDGTVAFVGSSGNGQPGIYTATLGGVVSVAADTHTPVPGGTGDFTSLNDVATSGGFVAFRGMGTVDDGVYTNYGGSLHRVADTHTLVPGGLGTFQGFGADLAFDHGHTAFYGGGANGMPGIYTDTTGTLSKVISAGDVLDGKVVRNVAFSSQSLAGDNLVFQASFTDGSQGIYDAQLLAPPSLVPWCFGPALAAWPCFAMPGGGAECTLSPGPAFYSGIGTAAR
jgi:hypothetical protein